MFTLTRRGGMMARVADAAGCDEEGEEMGAIKRPTTAQLHNNSNAMYNLSLHWPYAGGTALALVPGAVHRVELLHVGYRFFTTAGSRPWKFFGRKAVDYQVHRCAARLVTIGQPMPELVLMDVLAFQWDQWSV